MIILNRVACVKCRVLKGDEDEARFYRVHADCSGGLVTDLRFTQLIVEERERMLAIEREGKAENVVENDELAKAVASLEGEIERKRVLESDDEDDVDLDRERVRKRVRKLSSSSSEVSNIVITDPPKSSSSPKVKSGGIRVQSARWLKDEEKRHVSQQMAHELLVNKFESLKKVKDEVVKELDELKKKELKSKEVADENIRMRRCVTDLKNKTRELEEKNDACEKRASAAERRMRDAEAKFEEMMKEMSVLRARNVELERTVARRGDERQAYEKLERMRDEWERVNEDRLFEFHIPIRDNHLAGEVLVNQSLDESILCYNGHPL
jgi:hypothetical protein